ncbi:hypothetical protein Acr_15g0015060 [Actinidia rufa]|uniref:Uncharacterized protein n=1 Tax=Actinidia rufa TaxID=165716 RepID=A0A7J0FY85_9ERIC|nr:hypothetical protein Acr_15g0015060 [Actinidia rufa]
MALLRTAMDSAFGNLNISSTETLVGGCAKAVPGEPFPVDGARASRAIRIQQLAIMPRAASLSASYHLTPPPLTRTWALSLSRLSVA